MFKSIAIVAVLCSSLSASAFMNMPSFSNSDFDNAGKGGEVIRRGVNNTVRAIRNLGSKVVRTVKVGAQTVVVTLASGVDLVLTTAENGVDGVVYHGNKIYKIVSSDVVEASEAVQGTAVYNAGKKTVTFVVAGGKKVVTDFSNAGKEVLEALSQL
jgi:hypothetical protein